MLNVNAVLDPVTGGGTAERTLQMSHFLREEGIDCSIMTTDMGLTEDVFSNLEGIRVIAYKCLVKRFYIPLVRYSQVKKVINNVDVVHLMGHWTVLNALVYMAAQSLNKPYVVCPAGALPIFGRSRIIKKLYNWIIGKRIIQNADACIAITEEEKNQFNSYGVNGDKITVIPNGINPVDFSMASTMEFRKKFGLNKSPFLLFVGRLNLIKGPDLLLDAFFKGQNDWKEWHLIFAGPDGGLLDSLKKAVDEKRLGERVHFVGYVGGDEKSSAYHAADCLVIPSRQEAMSIVVLEAGVSATPVILTDQCGFDQVETIGGGKVCSASVDGIDKALHDTLGDMQGLSKMGEALEEYVTTHYTWSVLIHRYIELYIRLGINTGSK